MSLPTDGPCEVLDLTWKLVNGEIDAAESQRLDELVATDASLRRLYLNALDLVAGLEWGEQVSQVRSWHADFLPGKAPRPRDDVAVSWIARGKLVWRRQSTLARVASIGLAAMVFYGTFAILAWNLRPEKKLGDESLASLDSGEPPALLMHADDAEWQYEAGANSADRTLRVRSGLAELKFAQGASVVIQGPAEFEARSKNSGFLRRGKLIATVPTRAIGFTIDTPTTEIVDLGTEFAVEVDDQQNAEVHVFKGVVETRQLNSPTGQKGNVRITAGNALRIDSQQHQPTPIAIRSKQQFGVAKSTKVKAIDRDMLIAEWDFLKDQNLTFAANGASKAAKLSGGATVDQGVALGSLSGNRQLMSGLLNALCRNGESRDKGIITEANWAQLFGSDDLTSGSFVVVFKPNLTQWMRCMLMSHAVQVGEFGQLCVSVESNGANTVSEVRLLVGPDDTDATMNVPALRNTDWYFLGGSWAPAKKSFLYLRNITDGKLCGTAIGNTAVRMHQGVMNKPVHLGLRNSQNKLSESANSLFAYAALLYPYWNAADQFDEFYQSLIAHSEPPEPKSKR
jgi:hypothetical protein